MQEEAVSINEDDLSDPEVVMLDGPKTIREQRNVERKMRHQVGAIDTQLKALGLYEEGLSFEQKEELLAVVAASRETAEHEESMRLKAKEWQGKVYPVENALTVEMTNLGPADKSSSDVISSKAAELKVDQPYTESCSSQELFDFSPNEDISRNSPQKQPPDESQSLNVLYSHLHDKQSINNKEDARQSLIESSFSHSTIQANYSIVEDTGETVEDDSKTVIQVDFAKQKRELEKLLPHWKPCSSPETSSLESSRSPAIDFTNESATAFADYEKFVQAIDDYHSSVKNFQRNSGVFIIWGHPITVGRTYITRSSRSRGADLENSDGVYSFSSSGGDDSSTGSSMCESYLRLREFSKSLDNRPSVSGSSTLTTVVRTPCQVGKPFLQSTLSVNKDATSKQARTCLRNVENSVDLTQNSEDVIPFDKGSENCVMNAAPENSALGKASSKNEYLVQAEICPQICSESGETNVTLNEGKLSLSGKKCNTISRVNGNTKHVTTGKAGKPVAGTNDTAPVVWDQANHTETATRETSKRRKSPDSLSNFNSPSKRLKETGTL